MPYKTIYDERTLRSVANATYRDGVEFLKLVEEHNIQAQVRTYPLSDVNLALHDLKKSRINGAGVLIP